MSEPKMRQLEKREQLPENYNFLDVETSRAIEYFSAPEYYGKFRAYLFVNFSIITVGMIVCIIRCLSEGDGETTMGFVTMAALLAGFCWLLWHPVAKKVRPEERRLVFFGMLSQGLMILIKLIMLFGIVTIPLINRVNYYSLYEYRYVSQGRHKGEYVLMRLKMNGQWEDIYGNKYDSE